MPPSVSGVTSQETRVEPNNAVRADAGLVQAGPQDFLGLRIKGSLQNGVFALERRSPARALGLLHLPFAGYSAG